jgi:Leucine-rich repeat (LRR) protein
MGNKYKKSSRNRQSKTIQFHQDHTIMTTKQHFPIRKYLLLLLLLTGLANAQNINFADPAFKAKLLAADASNNIATNFSGAAKIDTNNDGEIQISEAVEIYSLHVDNAGISDLTGISEFTSLQTLFCENNVLTSLDASNLSSLIVLVCSGNQLTSLNISGMFNLEALECSSNQLATLNVSGVGLSSLRGLSCAYNQLASINLSGISTLENLSCSYNLLTTLSVSGLGNLKSIDCGFNKLTTLSIASLTNLEILWCYNNELTTLNITGAMTSLHDFNCSSNQLTALNIPTLVNLSMLRCGNNQLTTLNTTNLINLKTYECDRNLMTTLNVSGLPLLEYLSCTYNQLTSLTVVNLANLKGLGCNNNLLTAIDFTGLTSMESLNFSYNAFPIADLSSMPNLTSASTQNNQLTSLNVNGLANLEQLFCMNNLLPTLNVTGLTNLKVLWCDQNELTALDVNGLVNLEQLACSHNHIPSLNVTGLSHLFDLYCPFNVIPALNVSGLTNLQRLSCGNNLLTALDATGLTSLVTLECTHNTIPVLNVSGNINLQYLFCGTNQIAALDITGLVNLKQLDCSENLLATLDASNCVNLTLGMSCGSNLLTTLFVKNGLNEGVSLYNNPDLQFVCADESQIADIQASLVSTNPNTVVSSYCSFTPGGNYNSITGTAHYDLNNNGCDATDIKANNVRFDLSDGTITSGTFLNNTGIFTLYAGIGNYTLNAHLENPTFFNMTPTTTSHNFPALDSTVITQDFCLTANGVHNDLEIVVQPINMARPGFDASYRVVFKNKGNQALSGNITFTYDDAVLDFVAASVNPDTQNTGLLNWNYTNLLPFEDRYFDVTLNVNSAVETPPVNINDILNFQATITPVIGDDLPADNLFAFHQAVVGSFDPNDITCLEGAVVPPSEIGNYLHYAARFENTGNHQAENVVVKVVVDTTKYDINSLQLLNTSHPSDTKITGNVVEFMFKNINLGPIAGDPPVGGHGTILFKIKTLAHLNAGDEVMNKANIFFDYNAPIETNDARTIFTLLSNPEFTLDASTVLYPNPTNGNIKIDCDNSIKSIEIYDIQGRIIQTTVEHTKTAKLDISSQSNGIYFVRVTSEKGKTVQKVIKE